MGHRRDCISACDSLRMDQSLNRSDSESIKRMRDVHNLEPGKASAMVIPTSGPTSFRNRETENRFGSHHATQKQRRRHKWRRLSLRERKGGENSSSPRLGNRI